MRKLLWCSLLLLMAMGVQTLRAQSVAVEGVTLSKTELTLAVRAEVPLEATVSPAEATNKEVTWTSDKPEVASVDINGKVTAKAAGEANVTVTTKDGGKTASCKVTVQEGVPIQYEGAYLYDVYRVVGTDTTLLPQKNDVAQVGDTLVIRATGGFYNVSVNGNEVLKDGELVTAEYTVTGSEGTIDLFVRQGHLCIAEQPEVLELETLGWGGEKGTTLVIGRGMQFDVTVKNLPPDQVIRELKVMGKVVKEAVGKEEYKATYKAPTSIAMLVQRLYVSVSYGPRVNVEAVHFDHDELTLAVGEETVLVPEITPADATYKDVFWQSDNSDVASVDDHGKVTAMAVGKTDVMVMTVDGNHVASCSVTVDGGVEVEGVAFNKPKLTLAEGEEALLEPQITPENASNKRVHWQSDNSDVATVDDHGKVTAVAVGTATVMVTTEDGGVKASCEVQVTKGTLVESVALDKSVLTLAEGEEGTLVPQFTPENATYRNVTWVSIDSKIATVDGSGRVRAKAKGETFVLVHTQDGQKMAVCRVRVAAGIPVEGVSLDQTALTLSVGQEVKLMPTVSPENASNKKVTWKSVDETIAAVDADGMVTAKKVGETTVTVTTEDGGKTASCKVKVVDRIAVTEVSLDKGEVKLKVGEVQVLKAAVKPADATNKNLTWKSDDETIAAVDENGKVTAKKVGETTVTVTTEDGGKTASCKVKVVDRIAVTEVSLDKGEVRLKVGEVQVLKAAVKPADATNRKVSWASGNEEIAAVDENGKVTAKAEGQTTITVTTEDGGKTASCEVIVEKVLAVESELLSDASVTPNPATDRIEVSSKERVCAYELFDANGRCVLAGTNSTPRFTIDISPLASGVYYCRLVDSEGRSVVRSVVKR